MHIKKTSQAADIAAFVARKGATVCPPATADLQLEATREHLRALRSGAPRTPAERAAREEQAYRAAEHRAEQRRESYAAYQAAGCASDYWNDQD